MPALIHVDRTSVTIDSVRRRATRLGMALSDLITADWTDFALIALLIVYVSAGPFQHFPPPGWVDPGIYTGYFRNLPGLLERYGPNYFVNRWPLVLMGRWLHATLPLNLADAALIATWYSATLLALRALLMSALGPVHRKIALVLYGCSPLVIATVTRTYADGPAIAFVLMTMAAVFIRPEKALSNARLFAAGGCAVFAVLTQPVSFLALGPMAAGLVIVDRRRMAQLTPMAFIAAGCGVAIALHVYAATAFKITGAGLFQPLLNAGQNSLNGIGSFYREPLLAWIFDTTRVFFVGLTVAAGLWTATKWKTGSAPPGLMRLFHWALISACGSLAGMIVLDTGMRTTFLQFSFCASYLLPATYILLGSIVAMWTWDLAARDLVIVLGATAGLSMLGCLALLAATADVAPSSVIFPMLVLCCCAGGVLAMRKAPKMRSVLPVIGLMAALCPLASVSADTRHVFRGRAASFGTTYMVLNHAADVIDPTASTRTVLFWFNRVGFDQALGRHLDWITPHDQIYPLPFRGQHINLNAIDTLNAFYLWDRSRLNDVLPNLTPADLTQLRTLPNLSIVAVSYRDADIALARASLSAAGIGFTEHDDTVIRSTALTLHLAIFDLDSPKAPAKP